MPLAVALELDDVAGQDVVGLWNSVHDIEGILTTGMLGAAPHLSLGIYRDEVPRTLLDICRSFARSSSPLSVSFPGLTFFPGETGTLCLGPVPTQGLLGLHKSFHHAMADFRSFCDDHYLPGAWVPHVTLLRNLQGERTGAVMERMQARWRAIEGTLTSMVVLQFRPVVELARTPLKDARPRRGSGSSL